MSDPATFDVGRHRPIYLWAGPGTVRMNRLKFMEAPVDEVVHEEAHTLTGATRVAREAYCNWAYLMYDWGFPPEIEREDWEAFEQAVPVYQAAGVRVFGYVQTSNYVAAGSYADKEWYARDPRGRPFYYYTGRYMSCWRHPEWRDRLRRMVWGIVNAGADGVFFDNPWHGTQAQHVSGTWMGTAGCYCERCREAFRAETGLEIPTQIDPAQEERSRRYLRWRAGEVTRTLAELAEYARSLNSEIFISANDFDAVMRPSFVTYGIDLEALAEIQDVMMIEDYGLPRWEAGTGKQPDRLVNNALTIRTARALIGDTPLSVDPYDKGIGFDEVYSARRFRQAIAEAAACGASMVVKGTEFVEPDGTFTLLTAEKYAEEREAIGAYHRWLLENADLYTGRTNLAGVVLLHPGDALWQAWERLAPLLFGAGQVLLAAGIPWRVVQSGDELANAHTLLHVAPLPEELELPEDLRAIDVTAREGWTPQPPSYLARHRRTRAFTARFLDGAYRAYFRRRWARALIDGTELTEQHFMRSSLFDLPSQEAEASLLEALGPRAYPRIEAEAPLLVEHWQREGRRQLHLVNYADAPQRVTLAFERPRRGRLLSPDSTSQEVHDERLELTLDVYTVLVYG